MTPAAVRLTATDAAHAAALLTPFNEQTAFDVAAGSRTAYALFRTPAEPFRTPAETPVGSAVLGNGELDLFVHPEFRARGLGAAAAAGLLELAGDAPLTAWSHGDHPAARALAARFGFAATRTLLQLSLGGLDRLETPAAPTPRPAATIEAFRPGIDDAEWLALNARVFSLHPEQGGMTGEDLSERMSEPWFRADDFLVARDADGRMVGYDWLKVTPPEGEIYVIGVAPEASGRGLGRALMSAGLARLRERGCTVATLYTEADNDPAVGLYRSLGFADAHSDVQYTRTPR